MNKIDVKINACEELNAPEHLSSDDSHRHYFLNTITKEQRPLTEDQYNDTNYTLNER